MVIIISIIVWKKEALQHLAPPWYNPLLSLALAMQVGWPCPWGIDRQSELPEAIVFHLFHIYELHNTRDMRRKSSVGKATCSTGRSVTFLPKNPRRSIPLQRINLVPFQLRRR